MTGPGIVSSCGLFKLCLRGFPVYANHSSCSSLDSVCIKYSLTMSYPSSLPIPTRAFVLVTDEIRDMLILRLLDSGFMILLPLSEAVLLGCVNTWERSIESAFTVPQA